MAFVSEMMPCSRGFLLSLCNRYSINLSNQVIIARKHHCVAGDNDKHHDIIIAGGGMVGTTLAVALG